MTLSHSGRREIPPRRGVTILLALAALVLAAMLLMALVRSATTEYRQIRRQESERQALWLAESGLERARARLAADAAYAGESWTIEPSELAGRHAAEVTIIVEKDASADGVRISARADYPHDETNRARVTRQMVLGPAQQ